MTKKVSQMNNSKRYSNSIDLIQDYFYSQMDVTVAKHVALANAYNSRYVVYLFETLEFIINHVSSVGIYCLNKSSKSAAIRQNPIEIDFSLSSKCFLFNNK